MKKFGFLPLLFLVLSLTSCGYTLGEMGLYKDGKVLKMDLSNLSEMDLNFETVKKVSLANCLQCHSSGGHAMDTAEKVLAQKDDILSAVQQKTMPPKSSGYPTLGECETKILETWIEDQVQTGRPVAKVKSLAACVGAEVPVEKPKTDFKTLALSFENLKREILAPKCLSCHAANSPGYQYVLENLDDIKGNDLIAATADESTIYQVIVPGRTRIFMPPKRSGLPALSAEETDYMKRWIDDGAKP